MWTGSVPVESGNRLSTGIGRCTQLGSTPSTWAVTPSMTSAVLPTSISMTVTSPGVTETSRGSSSVRTSDPDAALDGDHHRARRCRLDDELVAGRGGDHEAAGGVDPCRAMGRDDRHADGDRVLDLAGHPPHRERLVAAAVDAA